MEMMFDLHGKRALLAGTIDSVLVGVARTLHAAGVEILAERSQHWNDIPYETVTFERYEPDYLAEQIDTLDGIDFLIVNISIQRRTLTPFLDSTPNDWEWAIVENVEAPVFLAQAFARNQIARKQGGRIVFLMGVESLMPFEGTAVDGTTGTILGGIAGMMAVDLAPHGIRVNTLAIGWMEGETISALPIAAQKHILDGIPAGHFATSEDVGAAVLFLLSDAARYLTGTILPIDGGYTLTRAPGKSMLEP